MTSGPRGGVQNGPKFGAAKYSFAQGDPDGHRAATALEPTTQEFIDSLAAAGGPPLYTLSPAGARDVLTSVQAAHVEKPPASIEDSSFPVGPTGKVQIRIVRPKETAGRLPVVMHFHGGGWILGDKDTHDRLSREIAVGANAAVVFDYDRSPEAHYPIAIEQAYAATEYVVEHGPELGVDPSRLALIGDSVGGNMVAAVTLLAKERGGPTIDFQVLCYPVTDGRFDTESYTEFADGPWLTRRAMQWFWDAYLPQVEGRGGNHCFTSPCEHRAAARSAGRAGHGRRKRRPAR